MQADLRESPPSKFPANDVVAALNGWWEQELADAVLPEDPVATPDIMKPSVEIDSHRVVRALLVLQEVLEIEIPETVIKEGGYNDISEMIAHLVPRVQSLFEKQRKKQNA